MLLSKKMLDGNVETLLLLVLQDRSSYGYEIIQELNRRGGGLLAMGEGTAYPVLHRLEKRGLIASEWVTVASGRRRKYYTLTSKGCGALRENVKQWKALVGLIENFLTPGVSGGGEGRTDQCMGERA